MPAHNNLIEEIKSRLDVVDVLSDYVNLKKTGQNYKGLCPFHAEKTPSFMVSPSKQIFHCFGCGEGGNIFDFIIKFEGLSFKESLQILAKKAGVEVVKSRKRAVASQERENLLDIYRDAADFYQRNLNKYPHALEYIKKRGLNDEAAKTFSIGYAPKKWDALYNHLKEKEYSPELMRKAGLVVQGPKGYYDTFRNRILFPIIGLTGEIVAFGGRTMDDSGPKYLNSPESSIFNKSKILYGLNRAKDSIKKTGFVIFVEGYLDVITAHTCGFTNTVAPLGTALTQDHGKLIQRFTREAILVFDGDLAGRKAARSSVNILVESALESGLRVKILLLPDGEDPDSFLRQNGKDALNDLLHKACSLVDFFVMQEGDRDENIHELIGIISKIPNSVARGEHVRLLSEKLGIKEVFVLEELQKIRKRNLSRDKLRRLKDKSGNEMPQQLRKPRARKPTEEVFLLQLLLQHTDKAEKMIDNISEDDLSDPTIKVLYQKMKSGVFDYNVLIADCAEDERKLLTEVLFEDKFDNPDKIFQDCLKRLKSKRRQMLLNELQEKIKRAELNRDSDLLKTLLFKKQELLRLKG
jgi:DNA primase